MVKDKKKNTKPFVPEQSNFRCFELFIKLHIESIKNCSSDKKRVTLTIQLSRKESEH